jgi:dUTP pyrophosphatase
MVRINIKRAHKDAIVPSYAHEGDAGLDLFSTEDYIIKAGEQIAVDTGIQMAIPEGYVGLIWSKSGLASKNGIHHVAGVIDATYRGDIKVILKNSSRTDFSITKGMKVAQLLIQPVTYVKLIEAQSLDQDNSTRMSNGFGSTGK